MSFAELYSRAEYGVEAPLVTIEVYLSGGLPVFSIVGMAETAVKESKDRVRGALLESGFRMPQRRITVSLAPADMRKSGGRFDLAIAIGILGASGQLKLPPEPLEYFGELSLNGSLRAVPGLLPAALKSAAAGRPVVVPEANADEAALAGAKVFSASSLLAVNAHLAGREALPVIRKPAMVKEEASGIELADVRGQRRAKRALEIAAAGGHNLLFIGPPGTGKTMLARRLPGLLPRLAEDESLEIAAVRSVIGERVSADDFYVRPFRAPHHSASAAALVGGGRVPKPGEISLAHHGVLFLDELPEFNRNVLEVLREPLEAGRVSIARADYRVDFPSRFQLVAAMNPCPCGYLGDPDGNCRCSLDRVRHYRGRLSGPLLDRIDLQVEVPRQRLADLRRGSAEEEPSAVAAERVASARSFAIERQGVTNARAEREAIDETVDEEAWRLLETAAERFRFSARASYRIVGVARTIADLAGLKRVGRDAIAEALSLRQFDRQEACDTNRVSALRQ